jgi:hypothetical protein
MMDLIAATRSAAERDAGERDAGEPDAADLVTDGDTAGA